MPNYAYITLNKKIKLTRYIFVHLKEYLLILNYSPSQINC